MTASPSIDSTSAVSQAISSGRADEVALLEHEWATAERWVGIERTYTAADVVNLRGSVVEEHTLARLGAEKLWDLLQRTKFTRALGALTGNQAVQMVRGGLESIYLSGWQVAADANLAGQTYPDQSLYPANSVPAVVPPDQQRAAAGRPDRPRQPEERHRLPGADRGRRRGRLRRTAECLRTDEVDDRCRRGRRALGRSVGLGEEVRSSRWQGAHPDRAAHPDAERGPVGGRSARRPDAGRGPHRCAGGRPADQRRRPDRCPVHHRRADQRGILPSAQRDRSGAGQGQGVRPVQRPDLGGDRHPGSRVGARVRHRIAPRVPRKEAGLQLLSLVQLEGRALRRRDRRISRTNWAIWATHSSSSRWPGSMPSTTRCSIWPTAMPSTA